MESHYFASLENYYYSTHDEILSILIEHGDSSLCGLLPPFQKKIMWHFPGNLSFSSEQTESSPYPYPYPTPTPAIVPKATICP